MEAVSNVQEREVDLFLHSPGGSAEAAQSIVEYIRTRFDHIRVIVPGAAMSAATMIALSADEIVMGAHSQLGPIDPQFTIPRPEGPRSAPAQTILDQFELAKRGCADPKNIAGWLPILRSYSPGLIAQCTHQRELGESFVARWLGRYMFKDDPDQHRAQALECKGPVTVPQKEQCGPLRTPTCSNWCSRNDSRC
jgi:Serine dehydrogenase proteinase